VPEHDAEADVKVDFPDNHRDGRRQRQQGDFRFTVENGLQVSSEANEGVVSEKTITSTTQITGKP
jgi:hypothetical protein